jgi:hypothetical protein
MAPRTPPAYQNLGRLPSVQPGQWSFEETRNGVARSGEVCGDPLEKLKRELLQAEEQARRGCEMRVASSGLRPSQDDHRRRGRWRPCGADLGADDGPVWDHRRRDPVASALRCGAGRHGT